MLKAYAFFRHLRATAFCAEKGRAKMPERKILYSWKDISNYTGRGIRTIQRYEVQLSFPVHRPAGKSRSSVLAFSDEIDAWLNKAPTAATVPAVLPLPTLTAEQIRERTEWLAVAANAKRSHESARATFQACKLQSQRVKEMVERVRAAPWQRRDRPTW